MRIVVCDDCYEDALYLKSLLMGHRIEIYTSADSLLADVDCSKLYYDLYLLDIYIGGSINGIELARRIRAQCETACICFISSSDAFYREAYDLYAVQYLLKPIQPEAVKQLLDRAEQNRIRSKEKSLSFKWRGQAGSIPYGQILFISSREHTVFIQCRDGRVQECKGKINEFAQQLDREVFMRCHQSFLVNMYHVDNMDRNELTVSGYRIPISRRYYADVKERYREILFEEID